MTIKAIDGRVKWWLLVLAVIAAALWAINANAQGPTGTADPLAPAPTSAVDPGAQPAGPLEVVAKAVPIAVKGATSGAGNVTTMVGATPGDIYTIFQNPKKYTWGEWTTLAAGAVAAYYIYDTQQGGTGKGQKKGFSQSGRLQPQDIPPGAISGSRLQEQFLATPSSCGAITSPGGEVSIRFSKGDSGSSSCEITSGSGEHGSGTK